jgi:hypothetical protein
MRKATECEGMPAETQSMLVAKYKEFKLFHLLNRNKSENFHVSGKLHYLNQFNKRMESR